MAREAKSDQHGFDIEELRQLMELMEKHEVTELKLQQGEAKYVLRRGPQGVISVPVAAPAPVAAAVSGAPAPAPSAAQPAAAASSDEGLIEVKSPTVGTFYQSPTPNDPAFVKVGDEVGKETVVCIVEAMKVMNQIPADTTGTIAKILLKDGDAVQYGQVLFLVKPNS
ncbi:acetyl-CoA carboxylase biotin carboxyl carrier protein [Planctomicrobium sp.]|jgi:acetyl-CoA carboxylase biotin carboxyl carrier protein|nr:acetyl-CoA carboxylase biotin carboxyl carrier protein [Planctomicrobium sp.]MDB4743357.1 acetyl-CoA carboxylase biotin carboxyl carrier protein [Planctomicrobium sp.]